jgi:hypothetical protein
MDNPAVSIHSNELLGDREIGLMSDLKMLDNPLDQAHGKFNRWVKKCVGGPIIVHDVSQFFYVPAYRSGAPVTFNNTEKRQM